MDAAIPPPVPVVAAAAPQARSLSWATIIALITAVVAASGVLYFAWHEPACLPFAKSLEMTPLEQDEIWKEDKRLQREMNRRLPDGWKCSSLIHRSKYGRSWMEFDPTGSAGCVIHLTLSQQEDRSWEWYAYVQTTEEAARRALRDNSSTTGEASFYVSRRGRTVLRKYAKPDVKVEWQDRMEAVVLDLIAKAREIGIR